MEVTMVRDLLVKMINDFYTQKNKRRTVYLHPELGGSTHVGLRNYTS